MHEHCRFFVLPPRVLEGRRPGRATCQHGHARYLFQEITAGSYTCTARIFQNNKQGALTLENCPDQPGTVASTGTKSRWVPQATCGSGHRHPKPSRGCKYSVTWMSHHICTPGQDGALAPRTKCLQVQHHHHIASIQTLPSYAHRSTASANQPLALRHSVTHNILDHMQSVAAHSPLLQ